MKFEVTLRDFWRLFVAIKFNEILQPRRTAFPMKLLPTICCLSLLLVSPGRAEERPVFQIAAADVANIVVDATPGDPWIFSITLTKERLARYAAFTKAHAGDEISLVVAGTEIYRPRIGKPVDENPITFRMFEKDKFLAILSALPDDPK
jgi:hypothetical protein